MAENSHGSAEYKVTIKNLVVPRSSGGATRVPLTLPHSLEAPSRVEAGRAAAAAVRVAAATASTHPLWARGVAGNWRVRNLASAEGPPAAGQDTSQ